ncbi:hypothetical protein GCM10022394_25850 [Zobellella aerophila]|uniref:Uncharacterized protein n=1 Tax=Zobellella aerophila TaxID=870480 RepID=A0ABP6W474_9GAMM
MINGLPAGLVTPSFPVFPGKEQRPHEHRHHRPQQSGLDDQVFFIDAAPSLGIKHAALTTSARLRA